MKNTKETVKIVLVEEDSKIREQLKRCIQATPSLELIASYSEAETAIEEVRSLQPDIILTEVIFSSMDPGRYIDKIRCLRPKARIFVYTNADQSNVVFRTVQSGAIGYVLKSDPEWTVLAAFDELMRGGIAMTRPIARMVVEFLQYGIPRVDPDPNVALTYRENQIMLCLVAGRTGPQIAHEFNITESTVRSHIRQIYQKWQVHSRAQAILRFMETVNHL